MCDALLRWPEVEIIRRGPSGCLLTFPYEQTALCVFYYLQQRHTREIVSSVPVSGIVCSHLNPSKTHTHATHKSNKDYQSGASGGQSSQLILVSICVCMCVSKCGCK